MVRSSPSSSSALMRMPCWRPSLEEDDGGLANDGSNRSSGGGRSDGLLWYKDLGRHSAGSFSFAVVQANALLEDGSQFESGPLSFDPTSPWGTFVGVYDGHGGPETARYLTDHLFRNLKRFWRLQVWFLDPSLISK